MDSEEYQPHSCAFTPSKGAFDPYPSLTFFISGTSAMLIDNSAEVYSLLCIDLRSMTAKSKGFESD